MDKKLAIKGHPTRGKEVIELLKMMGVKGSNNFHGSDLNKFYYTSYGCICWDFIGPKEIDKYEIFTLEEFLDKYPYKVGDKVYIYVQNDDIDGRYAIETAEISSMRWNPARCKIAYKMKDINREFYKEEIKYKVDNDHTEPSKMKNILAELLEHIKTTPKEELEKEFKEIEEWSNVGPTVEEFMAFCECVNKKPKYPNTYNKCYDILNCFNFTDVEQYNFENDWRLAIKDKNYGNLMNTFVKLLICRDAYWKIAGEEMGLDKPWEPDWNDHNQPKFGIHNVQNNIRPITLHVLKNLILIFPTEEMRDAFYENFKNLIEQCKELL